MIKTISYIVSIVLITFSCGPSEAEIEQNRIEAAFQDCLKQSEKLEEKRLDLLKLENLNQFINISDSLAEKHNWKNAQTLVEKAQLLDKALFGHFLHAAEEWGLNLDKYKLKLNVKNCIKHQVVDCFHQKKLAFDVEISINCLLPIGFGLGQGASINFGRISKLNS